VPWSPARATPRVAPVLLVTLAFFFISGACGLLYQVVWTRQFVLLFGAASYAVSTVLSVFFLGLGAGSLWGGRLADRTARPLALYGLFEVLIGLWALALLVALGAGETAVVALLRLLPPWRAAAIGLRAALAFGFLVVPVMLMGATLPLLAKFVTTGNRVRGMRIGALYTLNTLGAVAGCALTGFVFIARFGYTRTVCLGAAANVAVGVAALLLGRAVGTSAPSAEPKAPSTPDDHTSDRHLVLYLAAFALSGFCALALEVLWTRLLAVVFLGTTYAFTTMLTTLLCGIAAGSAVASAVVDRFRRPGLLFGLAEMGFGLTGLLMLAVFAGLPARLDALLFDYGYDWGRLVQAKFGLAFSVLFLPTFFSGMTFPLVVKAIAESRRGLGRDIGRLYSANTFGGVAGALAGGYVILPLLGTHRGIMVLAAALFTVGLVVTCAAPGPSRKAKSALALASLVLVAPAMWHAARGDIGSALSGGYIPDDHAVLYEREGVEATVAVSAPLDAAPG